MGSDDLLTDDYVADLLAKEASDYSLKYSTMGMEAYTSSSRPASKFKPNTRFLRNIIKGTNRHNDALTAKEQSEAQARLKNLAGAEEKRKKYNPSASETRGRQLGNIAALLGGKPSAIGQKRKRPSEENGDLSDLQKARAVEDARRLIDTAAARRRQKEKSGKRRRSLERYSVKRGRKCEHEEDATYYRRNSSSEDEIHAEEHSKTSRRKRSRSPRSSHRNHRHRSPIREKRKSHRTEESSTSSHAQQSDPSRTSSKPGQPDEDADSDPSEDLIGPQPAPKILPRGRGALRGVAGMDSRFSSDYDPKSDIQMDEDLHTPNDWDEALEIFRDRAKMKQQGADRLREAGFSDEQVKKWEKGGEKTIDDVQWTKEGEKREWDRGKDFDWHGDD